MGRVYTIEASGAETAAGDFLEILCPSDSVMKLHQVVITQSTEAGDAASEQVTCTIERNTGAPTSGSGGSTPTPIPVSSGDVAAGIVAEAFNTTDLTGGTSVVIHRETWNVMAGMNYLPIPQDQPEFAPSTRCMIKLVSSPADSITFQVVATVEELGG
jgi:hypothetical protein